LLRERCFIAIAAFGIYTRNQWTGAVQQRTNEEARLLTALLAPFSFTTDVSTNPEKDILLSQTGDLGEPQASLDSNQKDRVIASANPRSLVRRSLRPTPTRTCSKAWWLVAAPPMPRSRQEC
jgi:hypothetical protein